MDKTFRAFDPGQDLLLPPSLDDWLPADHVARFIADLVDEHLDLSRIQAAYTEGRGAPPYDPRLMVRILLYGYTTGVRSSRKLEAACVDVVAFRWLAAGTAPDYRSIARQPVTDAELEDAYLANAFVTLWHENWRVYGARKLWKAAGHAGLEVGRDQVARLMLLAGIRGVVRGRHATTTTRSDPSAPRHPDLVGRGWDAPRAVDELWVADFSYVWTLAGFVYAAFVVDVYSRRILGWRVSSSMRTQLVLDAFRQALHTRHRGDAHWTSEGLIHHSDAGSQFTSVAFTAELLEAGIAGSIGTVGAGQRLVRVHDRTVQDRGHRRWRTYLDRPLRRGVAGRPLGPLVQHPTTPLIDRLPATD